MRASIACLLPHLLFVVTLLAPMPSGADETAWPPPLKGAVKGTATVESTSLLEVPKSVAELAQQEGSAKFVVAKTPPKVQIALHDQLGENAATRRLWSSWGDIALAKDGSVYCAIGDHGNDVGGDARCFLYRWNPRDATLQQVVDMNRVVPPKAGQPAWSKVHAKIDEGPDGLIYFSCTLNDGNRAKLPTYGFHEGFPGGQVYRYDPATGQTSVFTSLPTRRCTATSLLDTSRHLWWCNLEAGEGNALWCLDLKTGKPVYQGEDGSVGFNRNFALGNDGAIYFNGPAIGDNGPLLKLNLADKTARKTNTVFQGSPGMRCTTRETKDGQIYGITHKTNQLFRYDTRQDELEMLGHDWLAGSYVAVCELSPDEKYVYYLPGAHGKAWNDGTPVLQYDIAKRQQKVIAFLAPMLDRELEYVPGGTYGIKLSADGSVLYVNFNGHPSDRWRPAKMKPIGFGLTSFAAIHIPASER
jgi:sugar lactone lactonase YvrE